MLDALHRATGWDPRDADLVVGTSAGAGAGALLRGGISTGDLMALMTGEPFSAEGTRLVERLGGRPPDTVPVPPRRLRMSSPQLLLRQAARPWRARVGTVVAGVLPEGAISIEGFGAALRGLFGFVWPSRDLWVCAVRLSDGKRVSFGRPGAPPADVGSAVSASSAIPGVFRPVEIGGERYVDGGAHSPTNLDLVAAAGLDLVIVSSPMSAAPRALGARIDTPARMLSGGTLARERARVRRSGTSVVTFQPSREDLKVMGLNAMDPSRRGAIARQARESALRRVVRDDVRERLALLERY